MDLDVSIGAALLAGALSFLSPCVLPLVPPYLCYISGLSLDDLAGEEVMVERQHRTRVLLAALCFVLGFTTVFVLLGAGASAAGQMLRQYHADSHPACRCGHHHHGAELSRPLPLSASWRATPAITIEAESVTLIGCLWHRPGLRLRLDALHRAGARCHSFNRRLNRKREQGHERCWPSIRSASAFPSCSPP